MTWILTRSGKRFDLSNPKTCMVDPLDIAHSLSMQCRFNGHTAQFYSVAEHCLMVAELAPPAHQLAGLLHDATEAYAGDLVRPLKVGMRDFYADHNLDSLYDHVEHKVWIAICQHFDLEPELPESVKRADLVALATEKRDLMPAHPDPWPCLAGITPAATRIDHPLSQPLAANAYHRRLMQLLATTHRERCA